MGYDFSKLNLGGVGKADNIGNINGNNTNIGEQRTFVNSGFGDGFAANSKGFVRIVVPEGLDNKFNGVIPEKYNKDVAQLTVSDRDYQTTGINSDRYLDAPEPDFCEC